MDLLRAIHRFGAMTDQKEAAMDHTFLPVEAISSLWEMICFAGTLMAVAAAWLFAPR